MDKMDPTQTNSHPPSYHVLYTFHSMQTSPLGCSGTFAPSKTNTNPQEVPPESFAWNTFLTIDFPRLLFGIPRWEMVQWSFPWQTCRHFSGTSISMEFHSCDDTCIQKKCFWIRKWWNFLQWRWRWRGFACGHPCRLKECLFLTCQVSNFRNIFPHGSLRCLCGIYCWKRRIGIRIGRNGRVGGSRKDWHRRWCELRRSGRETRSTSSGGVTFFCCEMFCMLLEWWCQYKLRMAWVLFWWDLVPKVTMIDNNVTTRLPSILTMETFAFNSLQ